MPAPRVVVIIPALDEEQAIGDVVRDLVPLVSEVIVVDNGSRDRTAEGRGRPARGWCASRGAATARPASPASPPRGDADVLAFLDGDHSDDPRQLAQRARADPRGQRGPGDRLAAASAAARPARSPGTRSPGTRVCVGLMNLLAGIARHATSALSARSGGGAAAAGDGATATSAGRSRCR